VSYETIDVVIGYDIIGDIHGCANKLKGLLQKLAYEKRGGIYQHPERKAIFVGDVIDRGDQQVETLELVRAMVEAKSALIVMGNHEFNAISYATPNPETPGEHMRPHNGKNRAQHKDFVEQVQIHAGLYSECIEWFKTMPLYLELDGLRVVHACWNERAVNLVRQWIVPDKPMSTEFVIRANQQGTYEHWAIEILLKGPEVDLRKYGQPDFKIPGDHLRHDARIRWWNPDATTLRELAEMPPGTEIASGEPYPQLPDDACYEEETRYDYEEDVPVLYGHYWRKWNPEEILEWSPSKGQDWTSNTACVDFSAVKGGPLVAYQWDGESVVSPMKYVAFPSLEEEVASKS
jgi:hypothetical protein